LKPLKSPEAKEARNTQHISNSYHTIRQWNLDSKRKDISRIRAAQVKFFGGKPQNTRSLTSQVWRYCART
jgi:hypothetical protein